MNRGPHTILAVGLAFYILSPDIEEFTYLLLSSSIGGIAPDIDRRYRHRKLLHNIPVWITVIGLLTYILYINLNLPQSPTIIKGLAIGVASHLTVDSLTIRGIAPLYPIKNKHISLAKIKSNNTIFNTAGVIIGAALFTSWIYRTITP